MVYISHPYSGNEDKNIKEAQEITIELATKNPNKTFINPLATFHHLEIINASYENCLKQCLELLSVCDSIIMTGDWKNSKGCLVEYEYAKEHGLELIEYGNY